MKKWATIAVVLLLLLATCGKRGEGSATGAGEAAAGDDSTLRLAYVPTLAALPLVVAEEQGLFTDEGLSVVLLPFAAAIDIDTALVGGSVDGAATDLFRVAQLWRKDSVPLVVVRSTAEQWTLVSNRAARLNELSQMGDKMVAMTRFSATDYLSDRVFGSVRKTAPTFKVQINDVELRLRMLDNNEMDAAWLPEPYATRATLAGHKVLCRGERYKLSLGVLALRRAYTERVGERRDVVAALATAYDRACDTINKYGIPTYLPALARCGGNDSAVVSRLPAIVFTPSACPDSATLTLSHRLLEP